MCGIVCAWGPERTPLARHALERLSHRGPDGRALREVAGMTFGFVRLAINDPMPRGMQPHETGTLIGVFNGEVYNHHALRASFGIDAVTGSDTAVILPMFRTVGIDLPGHLDGFLAGIIHDGQSGKLFAIRDSIGKKPLFLVRCGASFLMTSELKAALHVDDFRVVPPGLCEIDRASGTIIPRAPPLTCSPPMISPDLADLLRCSVDKRTACIDQDRFAVFLSGGLDSSIIAALVESGPHRSGARYFHFDDPESEDTLFARRMLAFLGVEKSRIRPVRVPGSFELTDLVSQVIHATESYNPSIISNGVGTFVLARAARRDGLKVALGGDGADEVFCGYFDPPGFGPDSTWRDSRNRLLADLHRTELRRIDGAAMAHAVEVRCPFLDKNVRAFAEGLEYEDFYGRGPAPVRKSVLRLAFSSMLPEEITRRPKQSFDRGTGLQKHLFELYGRSGKSEMDYLHSIWRQHFGQTLGSVEDEPYFHSYPAFDQFLADRRNRYAFAPVPHQFGQER